MNSWYDRVHNRLEIKTRAGSQYLWLCVNEELYDKFKSLPDRRAGVLFKDKIAYNASKGE